MAITLSNAAAKAMCDALVDLVDVGGAGDIVIMAAADAVLCTIACSATAFGAATTASPAVATLAGVPLSNTASGAGTAIAHKFQDGSNTEVWRGSVGTSGADLNLSSTTIAVSDTVTITAYTVSQPTS